MSKKKNTEELEKYRARTHCLLLYPDCEEHVLAMELIRSSFDYAAILHDKDLYTAEDEEAEKKKAAKEGRPVNESIKEGKLKKPHWHFVVRTGNNGTWNTALAKDLSITVNYIKQCRNVNNALMYLLHYNDTDKYEYNIDDVDGPMRKKLQEIINSQEKSEGEKVSELISYIKNVEGYISFSDFVEWVAENGYWADYRRAQSTFCRLIDEHNYWYNEQIKRFGDLSHIGGTIEEYDDTVPIL